MLYESVRAVAPRFPFLARDRSGSYHTFSDHLREFIASRLDGIDPYAEFAEYRRRQELASRLHDRLLDLLPEPSRPALQEYADALAAAYYLETAILAEKAFLDGVRVMIRAMLNVKC